MPGHIYASATYRYGFNCQEKDNELAGVGNHNTAQFWEYDTRLCRRWNIDPVLNGSESSYLTFSGNPILYNDVNGDCKECDEYQTPNGNKQTVPKGTIVLKNNDGSAAYIVNGENAYGWDSRRNGYYDKLGTGETLYNNPSAEWSDIPANTLGSIGDGLKYPVLHPIKAAKNLGHLIEDLALSSSPTASSFFNTPYSDALIDNTISTARGMPYWGAQEWGQFGSDGLGFAASILLADKGVSKITAFASRISLTTADGFLFRGISMRAPFDIPVQRFGAMNLGRPDFWGLRVGSSTFVARRLFAILPEWNDLTVYTTGFIPKGTPMKFGFVGPQGFSYPGGLLQFIVNSKEVLKQSTKIGGR